MNRKNHGPEDCKFCAVDESPCGGQCAKQSRIVGTKTIKKGKEVEEVTIYCPAIMHFNDLCRVQQNKYHHLKPKKVQQEDTKKGDE
jgi:hypothetical protein